MAAETALVALRAIVYVDLLLLFGFALFGLAGLGSASEAVRALPLRGFGFGLAVVGLAASALQIVGMAAAMAGTPPWPVNLHAAELLLGMSGTGTALVLRMAALVLVLLGVAALPRRSRAALGVVCAAAALAVATLAWAGHGAVPGAGGLHPIADIVHLLAAGAWIGALAALVVLLFDRRVVTDRTSVARLTRALEGFAFTGTLLVATIFATGIINIVSLLRVEGLEALPESPYGRLLIAKLLLFLAMLGLAAANRFGLSPALARAQATSDAKSAVKWLRFSVVLESSCATAILVLVASLGMLAPPR